VLATNLPGSREASSPRARGVHEFIMDMDMDTDLGQARDTASISLTARLRSLAIKSLYTQLPTLTDHHCASAAAIY